MKVAIVGCCHGELDKIYETLQDAEKENDFKVDLLIICGDFQAVRNYTDLEAMACPPKYRSLNTFWKYYKGDKEAPVLTLFIGGNHEASNYMQELPYGGWVAKNIYYFGYAGVVQFGGLRIAGLSGIFKSSDYNRGHYERPPYDKNSIRSVYHVRNLEVFRLKQISRPLDIFISHDWPLGVYNFGDVDNLLRRKKFFRQEVECGELGNPMSAELLFDLKPKYWFSAHLHCKFTALVEHEDTNLTKFLALDKCLPHRDFLQILDLPVDSAIKNLQLEVDPEWLVILRSTNHLLSLSRAPCYMPGVGSTERHDFRCTDKEINEVICALDNCLAVPPLFEKTAEPHDGVTPKQIGQLRMYINPQTELLCDVLSLTNPYAVFLGQQAQDKEAITGPAMSPSLELSNASDDEDDVCSDDDSEVGENPEFPSFVNTTAELTASFSTTSDSYYLNDTQDGDKLEKDGDGDKSEKQDGESGGEKEENPEEIAIQLDQSDEQEHRENKEKDVQEEDTDTSVDGGSLDQSFDSDELNGGHGTDSSVDRGLSSLHFSKTDGPVSSTPKATSKVLSRLKASADNSGSSSDERDDTELMPPPKFTTSSCVQPARTASNTPESQSASGGSTPPQNAEGGQGDGGSPSIAGVKRPSPTASTEGSPRKMKRRNVDIYQSEEDKS